MPRLSHLLLGIFIVVMGAASAQAETVIYLVRHAETAGDTSGGGAADPALNDEGIARAEWLAEFFANKKVSRIFSTDFVRTKSTVGPLADKLEREIESYDPRALEDFAARLRSGDGVVVVAGHSNTTPALVNALVGEMRFHPLQHFQYDFIFKVHLSDDGDSRVSINFSQPRSVYGDHPSER